MIVELDACDIAAAQAWSKRIIEKVRNRPNYTGLSSNNRYLVGRLGEIAVRKWAVEGNLRIEETVNCGGVADQQDFLFYTLDGRRLRVNVKNSLHPRARYLMQPVAQAEKHGDQDIYIGCSGHADNDGAQIRIWGYISQQRFMDAAETVTLRVPSLRYPLKDLYPMRSLAAQLAVA